MVTWTWLEIIWSLIAVIGLGFAIWNVTDAAKDVAALKQTGRNGILRILATQSQRTQIAIATILLLELLAGFIAGFSSSNPQNPTATATAFALLFVAVELLLVYLSIDDFKTRRRILALRRKLRRDSDP